MVWVSRSGRPGSPLMEIGTSPTPNAWSIVNCPAANASPRPSVASRSSVTVSSVSRRMLVTRKGCGSHGSVADRSDTGTTTSAGMVGSVQVEQTDAGRLQPVVHHLRHPLHERVAEGGVLVALGAEAG